MCIFHLTVFLGVEYLLSNSHPECRLHNQSVKEGDLHSHMPLGAPGWRGGIMGGMPPGGGPAEGGPGIIRPGIGWPGPIGPEHIEVTIQTCGEIVERFLFF